MNFTWIQILLQVFDLIPEVLLQKKKKKKVIFIFLKEWTYILTLSSKRHIQALCAQLELWTGISLVTVKRVATQGSIVPSGLHFSSID